MKPLHCQRGKSNKTRHIYLLRNNEMKIIKIDTIALVLIASFAAVPHTGLSL